MHWTPSLLIRFLLSLAMLSGYFTLVYLFVVGEVKYSPDVREPIIMIMQAIGVAVGAMIQYWFGTSQSGAERAAADHARVPVVTNAQTTSQTTVTTKTPEDAKP